MVFGVKKQILLVGNDGVQLYVTRGKRTSLYHDFSDAGGSLSSELRKAFKSIGKPLMILFDVVEQQYRKETIPDVGLLDKKRVIQRKLMMAFPQQQMRAYLQLKKTARDGEGIVALFAGLAPNLSVTQIMDAVLGSEVPLLGAGLLPVESASLVTKLKAGLHKKYKTSNASRWGVLMTYHKTGGLRQIVVKDGEMALTRLTPLAVNPDNAAALADEMQREFNATQTYLSRFGFLPSDGLDLIIVSSEPLCRKISEHEMSVTRLYAMTPVEAEKLAGMELGRTRDEVTSYADIVHAAWAGVQRKPVMKLSAPLLDKLIQARDLAGLLSVLCLMGLGAVGWLAFDLYTKNTTLQSEIVDIKSERIVLQTKYDELSKKLNTLRYAPEQTKLGLDIYDEFSVRGLHVEPVVEKIISAVDKSELRMKTISIDSNASTSILEYLQRVASGAPPSTDPNLQHSQMTVTFEIEFKKDTPVETAARMTNALADKLRGLFPGRNVTVEKMVGNLALDKTMQGISEQIAQNIVEGRLVKQETSTLKITGVAE
jgi:hypothetical protein